MPSDLFFVLFWIIILAWFGYLVWRSFQGRRRQQQMLASLQPGDEVITSGGLIGVVRQVEQDQIEVEAAPNVRLRFVKAAVAARQPRHQQRRVA